MRILPLFRDYHNGAEVKICGLVSGLKEIVTKKGDRMAFLNLEDMKGFVEVILFPEVFKAASALFKGRRPHPRSRDTRSVRGSYQDQRDGGPSPF